MPMNVDRVSTMVELLHHRAAAHAERPAFTFLGDADSDAAETWSYAELDRRSRAVGAHIQEVADPGARALVICAPGPHCVAAIFGCV